VIRTMWDPSKQNYDGRYYKISAAHASPLPLQKPHPRIWVGGTEELACDRSAARRRWNAIFASLEEYKDISIAFEQPVRTPDAIPRRSPFRLGNASRSTATQEGRGPRAHAIRAPRRSVRRRRSVTLHLRHAMQVAEQVPRLRDLGVGQFVLWHEPPFDSDAEDQIREFAETVMPLLR